MADGNRTRDLRMHDFGHITDWVFDLDNTLYPRSCDLFRQVDTLMTQYVIELTGYEFEAARRLQKELYLTHGTTLKGLMETRNVDPEHYLDAVHNVDYSSIAPHPELISTIERLPGRKYVFTNADAKHADKVLKRLGGAEIFDGMFDIAGADYQPKPHQDAYEKCLSAFEIDPLVAAMFDDLERNLRVPHQLGMATIHVVPDMDDVDDRIQSAASDDGVLAHVHHTTSDLPGFLGDLVQRQFPAS